MREILTLPLLWKETNDSSFLQETSTIDGFFGGVRLCEPPSIHAGILAGLILSRSCVCSHSCCKLIGHFLAFSRLLIVGSISPNWGTVDLLGTTSLKKIDSSSFRSQQLFLAP